MRLLYLCEADTGGIAEYAVHQVEALREVGADVTLLCRPSLPVERVHLSRVLATLPAHGLVKCPLPVRILNKIQDARQVARCVKAEVESGEYSALLFACYSEYFSPFWARIYRQVSKHLVIGTIAHDPVRDYVVGPLWWHRWSIRQAYSFIDHIFLHDDTPVDFGGYKPKSVQIHQIPHGPYQLAAPVNGREAVRMRYGFTKQDQVFLAFGQIRDGKNLDRVLRAMVKLPEHVKLLVAGSVSGSSQRQPDFYQSLAKEFGLADRCVWDIRYIPDGETGDLFAASDYVLMSYSAKFRSASGVMNAAVNARKPILGSSGTSPFRSAMHKYGLGVFVKPDDDGDLLRGAKDLIESSERPDWDRYERENSWDENARRVIERLYSGTDEPELNGDRQ